MNKILIVSLTALGLLGSAIAAKSSSSASMSAMSMSGSSVAKPMTKVNVNSASAADLQKIPGVSAKLAAEIVKMRPYKDQAELVKKVKGIGEKNVLKMAPYIGY